MNYTATDPARKPAPELAESEAPASPVPKETSEAVGNSVVYLRMLWRGRLFLAKATICGLLVSAVLAFLIPARYESTARLMPPDNQSG